MADYLFDEALGGGTEDELRAAKAALMPLRGQGGPLGWAATVLLEGGTSLDDYDDAINIVMAAARDTETAEAGRNACGKADGGLAQVIPLATRTGGDQLALPGIDA
jgi:hypothetical protein